MGLDPTLITNAMAQWQQPADPLAGYAKLQALKNGVVQQQIQQQQLQSGALDLQEKQKNIQDQQALSDAFKASYAPDPTTGKVSLDENALYRNMSSAGLGSKIPAVQKSIQDANEAAVKFKQTQTAANDAAQEYLGQQLLYVKDKKYDPDVFTSTVGAAISHGAIPPAEAAQLIQRFQQNPTPAGVQALVDPFLAASSKAQDILTKRATALKDTAQGDAAAAAEQRVKDQDFKNAYGSAGNPQAAAQIFAQAQANGVSPAVLSGAPPPAAWTPEAGQAFAAQTLTAKDAAEIAQRKADAAATAARDAATEADRKVTLQQGAQRVGLEAQNLALRNAEYQQKYGDVLTNMSAEQRTLAEKLAAGEMNPAQMGRMPDKEKILAGAIAINPAWTQATYDTKQAFTSPEHTQAKNLGTISRIVGHIGQFEQNSQKMGFAPAYASGVNLTGDQNVLNEDAHAIAGELEKLVSGGVGSVEQVREWQKALHSPSADARQKAVDGISQLIGSQYEGMNQTYKAAIGSDLPITKYVSPAGQAWMKAKGINVVGAPPAAAGAAIPTVTTQAEFDKLPRGAVYLEDGRKYKKP